MPQFQITPGKVLKARVVSLYTEAEPYPETRSVDELTLDFEGIPRTRHHGHLRRAGSREPWYPRGSLMRSGRQVSIVSAEELAEVADLMALDVINPAWIGSNVVVAGVPALSWLPAGTRISAASGAVLVVEGQNAPCRIAGKAIAHHLPEGSRTGMDIAFAKSAVGRRGLVASVERSGGIRLHDELKVRIGRQWIYDEGRQMPLI